METLVQDVRFAIRALLRRPGFALTAVVTLALGIGSATAIFSVVNAVVLRPLPFEAPDRIVAITNFWTTTGRRSLTVSGPDFHDWRDRSRSFESMAYYAGGEISVTIRGTAAYATAFVASPEFFDVLRARAALGRLPSAQEQAPGGPLVAVVTDAFWRRNLNADPGAIGSAVKFEDRLYTIVAVLEHDQQYPLQAQIYVPSWVWPETTSRSAHNYRVIARLKDGVSLDVARAEMTAIARQLESQFPASNATKLTAVVPLQEMVVGDMRSTLLLLFAAVGTVLLVACANVGNLLLSRSTSRALEMVVRGAIGASRARIVRQLLTENAVLATLAAIAGAGLARVGAFALIAIAPDTLPRLDHVRVDWAAAGFAAGVAFLSALAFGAVPALHVSRMQLADGLRQGGKGSSLGARRGVARSAFVIAEVALAVVLVADAGLLARSLAALAAVDMGFAPARLLVLRTDVPVKSIAEAPRATAFYRDLLPELRAVPGVEAVAGVTSLPTSVRSNGSYWIDGGPGAEQSGVSAPQAIFTVVTPDYFRTMRIPLRSGRDFRDGDRFDAPLVAIVNESLARASFPGADPIGRRIKCGLDRLDFMTIVGVVADVRTSGPALPPQSEIFMAYEQHPGPASSLNLVARTAADDPLIVADTLRRKISARNRDVPVEPSTMELTLQTASSTPRFQMFLFLTFAGVALALALAGVYSVMAYVVAQRVPELGVRIALGATRLTILRLVLADAARLAGAGLAIGLALALLSGRLLQGMLFGITSRDPFVLAVVCVAVALATLAASYIPARRAVRVDPVRALRAE